MTIKNLVIVRHAARLDTHDKSWKYLSPTPYDTPLYPPLGFSQACETGNVIANNLPTRRVVIHSSPFLRCVQTAKTIADSLKHQPDVSIKIDAFLGEWQTPDYFSDITPPPADNHESLKFSSLAWLNSQGYSNVDRSWPLSTFGSAGEYGESWSSMYSRFTKGLDKLVNYYEAQDDVTVILVTHGAGCNPLLGSCLHTPVLFTMGLANFCLLKRGAVANDWTLTAASPELNSLLMEHGSPRTANSHVIDMSRSIIGGPNLSESSSTSTSCSSMSDFLESPFQPHDYFTSLPSFPEEGPVNSSTLLPSFTFSSNNKLEDTLPPQDEIEDYFCLGSNQF